MVIAGGVVGKKMGAEKRETGSVGCEKEDERDSVLLS